MPNNQWRRPPRPALLYTIVRTRVRTHVYVCTHVYTIVCTHVRRYTGVHNCEHSWTSLCADTNAQCSLNTMPKIWAALNHGQCRFFLRNFLFNFIFHNYTLYAMYSYMNMISGSFYRRITFMMWWCAINYEVFTQSLGKQQHVHIT